MIAALQKLKEDNGGKNLTIGLQQTSQSPNDYDHYVDVALVVVKENEKGEKTSEVIEVNGEDFEKCATVYTEYEADQEGGDDDDDDDDEYNQINREADRKVRLFCLLLTFVCYNIKTNKH